MNGRWIKIYDKMLDWEWYGDIPTVRLWLHLLITANYKDKQWRGMTIKRGQRFCSRATLADETGLSQRQVRTALEHLISTNEVTSQPTKGGTLITLVKYNEYQQAPTNGATNGATNDRPTTDQDIRKKEYKDLNILLSSSSSSSYLVHRDDEDDDLKIVIREWDKACGGVSSPAEAERIMGLYDQYGKEAMLRAIGKAVDHGAPRIAYIQAVLRRSPWADDLTEEEKRRNRERILNDE